MMTRKDYEEIGSVLKWAQENGCKRCSNLIAVALIGYLSWDNPLFNRGKFLRACGVELKPEG